MYIRIQQSWPKGHVPGPEQLTCCTCTLISFEDKKPNHYETDRKTDRKHKTRKTRQTRQTDSQTDKQTDRQTDEKDKTGLLNQDKTDETRQNRRDKTRQDKTDLLNQLIWPETPVKLVKLRSWWNCSYTLRVLNSFRSEEFILFSASANIQTAS